MLSVLPPATHSSYCLTATAATVVLTWTFRKPYCKVDRWGLKRRLRKKAHWSSLQAHRETDAAAQPEGLSCGTATRIFQTDFADGKNRREAYLNPKGGEEGKSCAYHLEQFFYLPPLPSHPPTQSCVSDLLSSCPFIVVLASDSVKEKCVLTFLTYYRQDLQLEDGTFTCSISAGV